jgi:hypothetical protein
MYQFYEKGIEIELGALLSPTVRINEDGRWFLEEYSQRLEEIPEDWKRIKVVVIGKLPFRNIIDYKDHDEYYSEYHLFCKYTGVDNSPYEEISYRYENVMGYFWNELDLTKKID